MSGTIEEFPSGTVKPEGTARIWVVTFVSFVYCFAASLLLYIVPLYFPARGLPKVAWETWNYYRLVALAVGPLLAGWVAAWVGDRIAWTMGMVGFALLGVLFAKLPTPALAGAGLAATGLLFGISSMFTYVASFSLAQVVPAERLGLSNALKIMAASAGGVAPFVGRLLVERASGSQTPLAVDFNFSLLLYSLLSILGGILIFRWGQQPVSARKQANPQRSSLLVGLRKNLSLMRNRRFLSLLVCICLLGGAPFAAQVVYLAYRAEDPHIGLILGARDLGWSALQASQYVMPILGGLLVGLIAGKKAPFWFVALLMAVFVGGVFGMGAASTKITLFLFSCFTEIMACAIGWVESGYISEVVREDQRAMGIGLATTFSGIGSWAFDLLVRHLQSPNSPSFSSALPFYVGAGIGLLGAAGLWFFDFWTRRRPALSRPIEV